MKGVPPSMAIPFSILDAAHAMGRASDPRRRVPRPDRRGRMTRRGKDTAIVSSSMSSLFIGWLAKAGQKASQHLRHLGPTNASVACKWRPVLEPAGVEKRLVVAGATYPRSPRRERYE